MVNHQKAQKCENYENCRIMTEEEVEFYDEYRFNLEGEDYYYSDLEADDQNDDAATTLRMPDDLEKNTLRGLVIFHKILNSKCP